MNNESNADVIRRLYKEILKREADEIGFNHFLNQMEVGNMDEKKLKEAFIISDEYRMNKKKEHQNIFLKKINDKISNLKLRIKSNEKKFSDIYKNYEWGGVHLDNSRSGLGSNLSATENIRNEIPKILKEFDVKSILDIPCGDFFWFKEIRLQDIDYIGADIVYDAIKENNKKYATEQKKFVKLDLINDELPKVDLILCRDALIHFSVIDIRKSIENIKRSNSKYFLTTSNNFIEKNSDIITGQWHSINLLISPFNFPKPLKEIREDNYKEQYGKCLLLWKISEL